MNSIKNVPARVLSRRPGHSLEAEREQFDKTQASGGPRGAGGWRAAPSPRSPPSGPLGPSHRPLPAPPPSRAQPLTPRLLPPASAVGAAPRAGEPEARAGAGAEVRLGSEVAGSRDAAAG